MIVWVPAAIAICCYACESKKIPEDRVEKIKQFIRKEVADSLEEDYRSHNINISVLVTNVRMDSITKKETKQDNVYYALGSVSYIIKGKRRWVDKEGNIIELDPEQEITHWFSCGILEDKYMGALLKDGRNRLTFYADNPIK